MAIVAVVYMRVFLQDSIIDQKLTAPIISKGKGKIDADCPNEISRKEMQIFKTMPSLEDMLCLLKSRLVGFFFFLNKFFNNYKLVRFK